MRDLERSAHLATQVSLEKPVGEGATLGEMLDDPLDKKPSQHLEIADQRMLLLEILESLKEQERQIIKMYYFESMLMKDIARILGVTESRVCQIHARLMSVLRLRCTRAGLEV